MFGPAPVTSATFPSSDTSNSCPFRAFSHRLRALSAHRYEKWDLTWRIWSLWSIWYSLGYRILHVGHFLHDLLALVAPWCTRAPELTGARHSARPDQCGAGHKNSSGVRAHDI